MVGINELNRIVRDNPSMNRKGVFQFVSGLTKNQAENNARKAGLKIVQGSFIGRGKTYRLIGYKKHK